MSKSRIGSVAFFVAAVIFLVDILSKYFTHAYLPHMSSVPSAFPYGGIPIFENFFGIEFSISHATNKGAAWGVFSDLQVYLLVLRIILIVVLFFFLIFLNKNRSYQLPLSIVLAGALGNVLDFFIYGHVIDMIHFVFWSYDYPVFNIADMAIFIGIALIIGLSFNQKNVESNSSELLSQNK